MTDAPERTMAIKLQGAKAATFLGGDTSPPFGPTEYIRADLAKPRVKPLVWKVWGSGLKSFSLAGEYQVFPTENKNNNKHRVYFVDSNRKSCTIGYFNSLEAAKAAAQADYERRILEALE